MERYATGRRVAVVIVNKDFTDETKLRTRPGADNDFEMLSLVLPKIGFHKIYKFRDFTTTEILTELNQVSKDLPDDVECFACFISSHGTENKESEEHRKDLVFSTNGTVEIGQLMEPFYEKSCPKLINKPKLFFIQACRGEKRNHGVWPPGSSGSEDASSASSHSPPPDGRPEDMPLRRDFLLSYSTPPEYIAVTNETSGSWFIKLILEVFETRCNEKDVLAMLTMVNWRMGKVKLTGKRENISECVLCAWTSSMLRKDVYLGHPVILD